MNKISSVLLSLGLMCTAGFAFSMEPMEKAGAMENGAMMKKETMTKEGAMMKKETMSKDGVMMKAQPKTMEKSHDKMEKGGGMTMEPKK